MSFIEKIFSGRKPTSSQTAKERLRLVLVHDRSNLSADQVASMRDEILEVISRYVDFDRENVQINLSSEDRESILYAEIPIMPASERRRRSAM